MEISQLTEYIWLIGAVALIIGGLIGFMVGSSGCSKSSKLSSQLEEAQKNLDNYKAEVNAHFEKTAELVNNLTNSYKDVHQHLASGAQGLCQSDSIDLALEAAIPNRLESASGVDNLASSESTPVPEDNSEESLTDEQLEPSIDSPKDYAPKDPEEEGTLSETFGLKKEKTEERPD